MPKATSLFASVVITTRNRVSDLCRAVESALSQSVEPQVVVIDDGSNDGTAETIRARYEDVLLVSHKESAGYIVRRNEAAAVASGDIVISIDDDSVFSTRFVVEKTLSDFSEDERIAAVAIPCIDVLKGNRFRLPFPSDDRIYITSEFIGTAYAVRRDHFLTMHGFRECLIHQGEERDFCIRLLEAGYVVRLGTSDPVHHFESPERDLKRQDIYGRRNDVLFAIHNVPLIAFPFHLTGTIANGIAFGIRSGRAGRMAFGLGRGLVDGFSAWSERCPVSRDVYLMSRYLRKRGLMPLEDATKDLKSLQKCPTAMNT